MIYRTKQMVSVDTLIDTISTIQGSAIDWEARARDELFNAIGNEMAQNLGSFVTCHDDSLRGTREITAEMIVYPKKAFDEKLKYIIKILDKNEIHPSVKSEILRTFLEDEPDLRNIKTYI